MRWMRREVRSDPVIVLHTRHVRCRAYGSSSVRQRWKTAGSAAGQQQENCENGGGARQAIYTDQRPGTKCFACRREKYAATPGYAKTGAFNHGVFAAGRRKAKAAEMALPSFQKRIVASSSVRLQLIQHAPGKYACPPEMRRRTESAARPTGAPAAHFTPHPGSGHANELVRREKGHQEFTGVCLSPVGMV